MKTELSVAQLLHWRLSQAEAAAPPAPRAARLLDLARPWWESCPEQFQSLVTRLGQIRLADGHAMTAPRHSRSGFPLPVLLALTNQEVETLARLIYFNVREGRLLFCFQLGAAAAEASTRLEATFVSDRSGRPLLCAPAALSADSEYHIDAALPAELAHDWGQLNATDRMPFRLLLHSETSARALGFRASGSHA